MGVRLGGFEALVFMSRLSDIVHLLRYGMRSPRETASLLNLAVKMMREAQVSPRETASLLNFLVSGMQSSRGMVFAPQRQDRDGPPEAPNPILSYFNAHTEGPGIWKWMHYFDIYQRHFHKFEGREVHVLEVGIYAGGSLSMWREYFGESCHVYGVDIKAACMAYEDEKTKVFIGDQADRAFWAKVRKAVPTIDILIDD